MTNTRPMLVELPFTAKPYDTDYGGIVHNMVYVRWLEDLRLQILAEHFPLEQLLAAGQGPVIERTEIVYKRPIRLFDEPIGRMWVSKLSRARWQVKAEISLGELLAAEATQSGYIMDLNRMRPVRIPEELRAKWDAGQTASERGDRRP